MCENERKIKSLTAAAREMAKYKNVSVAVSLIISELLHVVICSREQCVYST